MDLAIKVQEDFQGSRVKVSRVAEADFQAKEDSLAQEGASQVSPDQVQDSLEAHQLPLHRPFNQFSHKRNCLQLILAQSVAACFASLLSGRVGSHSGFSLHL
ncbi:hypothetical protein FRY77_29010 [Halomonas sp. MG34]|nr:hypothetical protein [Halomonas sp. MG34]